MFNTEDDWFFCLDMNFVCNKANSASYDCSFRWNIVEVCEKCCLYQPDDLDFSKFLEEISQLTFLKSEDVLLEDNKHFKDIL